MTAPIGFIYVLAVLFAGLTVLFLSGRGSCLLTVYKVEEKDKEKKERRNKKLSRVIGVCFGMMDAFLIIMALTKNHLPEWFTWIFVSVTGVCMFVIFFSANADIIIKD